MTRALPRPGWTAALSEWSPQPLAVAVVVALGLWYALAVRRLARAGRRWPAGRSVVFALGLALLAWTTCGYLQAYAGSLFWLWTMQTLLLLLGVPLVLLIGRPLQLSRACAGADGIIDRFLRSMPGRVLANPLVGPALIPLLSGALFFGPVPGWAVSQPQFGWLLQLAVLVLGGFVLLPLVGMDDEHSSLRVGLSLALGAFELVINAMPGIFLRMQAGIATSYFDHRVGQAWSPTPLHDQQTAGAVLSVFAGLITLPFVIVVFRRWTHADARDAASIDAVLEAERIVRGALDGPGYDPQRPHADKPWWLNDPQMRSRLHRTG